MLLVTWKDFYGDKDPEVYVEKRWRYSEEKIAAMNRAAKSRKIIESKYLYSKLVSELSPQVESFVLKLYNKYITYSVEFKKGPNEHLCSGSNVCKWELVGETNLPVSIVVERNWGYHDCGFYDYLDVCITPSNNFNDQELVYIKSVTLSMFKSYMSEKGRKDRKEFLDRLSCEG